MDVKDIKRVLVVGAGTMGHAIAHVYATAGFNVDLVDTRQDMLDKALSSARANLDLLAATGHLEKNSIDSILSRIHASTRLEAVAPDADLVVEAITEDPDVKAKLFVLLDAHCKKEAIIASNTSGLNVFKIAKALPERLPGLIIHHWTTPPHAAPVVEIVPGRKTAKDVISLSVQLLEKLGKKPVVLKHLEENFIVNKINLALGKAVMELMLLDVATPETIDMTLKYWLGTRLPIIGVIQAYDFMGLDVIKNVLRNSNADIPLISEKVDKGELGVKSGKGLFDYSGRSEREILEKRDRLMLQLVDLFKKLDLFNPI